MRRRGAATVLAGLRQEGCLKARFPRPEPDAWTGIVTLNTSGGIAAGDRLDSEIEAEPGAGFTVATQAAERLYRALPGAAPAQISTRITVAADAGVEWLPQETILFDGCAMDRTLSVQLTASSWFLGVEALVFGRAAMGEQVVAARCHDRFVVRRDGRLLLHDAIRFDGPVAACLQRPAIAGGARAVATLVHAAPALRGDRAGVILQNLRDALADAEAGASLWNGLLVARILAPDQAGLRRKVIAGLQCLRACRKLPRVWLC